MFLFLLDGIIWMAMVCTYSNAAFPYDYCCCCCCVAQIAANKLAAIVHERANASARASAALLFNIGLVGNSTISHLSTIYIKYVQICNEWGFTPPKRTKAQEDGQKNWSRMSIRRILGDWNHWALVTFASIVCISVCVCCATVQPVGYVHIRRMNF